jgi:FkbM family methyltransferase
MIKNLLSANPFWLNHITDFSLPLHFAQGMSAEYLQALATGLDHQQQNAFDKALDSFRQAQEISKKTQSDQGFAHHLELLFCTPEKDSPEFQARLEETLEKAPHCGEYVYNKGLLALQRGQVGEALESFEAAAALTPHLKEVQKALGIMYTLLRRWPDAEAAILAATGGSLENGILDLCLFAAQEGQGKGTGHIFKVSPPLGEQGFPTQAPGLLDQALSYLPPINTTSLLHSSTSPYILFLACDNTYFYEHALPLIWSLATLKRPVDLHLHLFNPDSQALDILKTLGEKIQPVTLKTSFEYVSFSYYTVAPGIYYSSVRFCRMAQLIRENSAPVLMIDVDSLVRKDLSQIPGLLDPTIDVGLCFLENEPLWNQMAAGIFYAKPTPAAAAYLSFLSSFIVDNIRGGTARWFLDQVGLALGGKALKNQVRIQFLEADQYLSTEYNVQSCLWTVVNGQKTEASPYNIFKESLVSQFGSFSPQEDLPFNNVQNGKYGLVMYNINDQFIGQSVRNSGTWCDHEIQGLAKFIQPGDTVLDVGANIGTHTLAFARLVGPQGRVLAFEAQPLVYQSLVATMALNSLEGVRCHNVAVGATAGEIMIPLLNPRQENQNFGGMSLKTSHLPSFPQEKVRLLPLDDLALEACHLIKIDVEGMEEEVLQGAQKTIQRCAPFLYIENHEGKYNSFVRLLTQWGYKIYKHGTDQDPNNLCIPSHGTLQGLILEQVA